MQLRRMSIPCIGCERKIHCEFEIYCLDCEHAIFEIEENAFVKGYEIGLLSRPVFHPSVSGFPAKFIVTTQLNIEDKMYQFLHTFLIRQQDLELKEDVKRLHYNRGFMDGYTEGYKAIYKIHNQHRLVLKDLLIDLGKRQANMLLISRILRSKQINHQLVDYNLVPFIKKFIT